MKNHKFLLLYIAIDQFTTGILLKQSQLKKLQRNYFMLDHYLIWKYAFLNIFGSILNKALKTKYLNLKSPKNKRLKYTFINFFLQFFVRFYGLIYRRRFFNT